MALLAPPDHADDYFDLTQLAAIKGEPIHAYKQLLQEADEKLNQSFYQCTTFPAWYAPVPGLLNN